MATHIVRSGETLSGIAQRYGLTLEEVLARNPAIVDPDVIHAGQEIVVAVSASPDPATNDAHELLPGFRGDLEWVHAREGHRGQPYWPGGASGVTLDPGIDLGFCDPALADSLYAGILSAPQVGALRSALGVRREQARERIEQDTVLRSIRITREQALALFPHAAAPYWRRLCERFPTLPRPTTPAPVHTAFLSLGYNRGPGNRHLEVLTEPLTREDWQSLARAIAGMQQNHRLPGIRKRRRMEAALIERALREERA